MFCSSFLQRLIDAASDGVAAGYLLCMNMRASGDSASRGSANACNSRSCIRCARCHRIASNKSSDSAAEDGIERMSDTVVGARSENENDGVSSPCINILWCPEGCLDQAKKS